jgi:glycosyltransferase involved in cell wall biosynthesis
MRILFLTSGDRVPSTRFRILPYVPHLEAAGHQCVVASSVPQKYERWPAIGWRLSRVVRRGVRCWHLLRAWLGRFDVVFVEREIFDDATWRMEAMFRKTAPVFVLDVDDGVFFRYPEKFSRLFRMSDLVVAGNRFLKDYIEPLNPQVVVIPTCLDLDRYRVKPAADDGRRPAVIGWTGLACNYRYLRHIEEPLRRVAARFDCEIHLIAERPPTADDFDVAAFPIRFHLWNAATEIEDLQRFDVGLMPLFEDQEWDRYKCGLKILQYMAIGIPAVASPVGVNADIIRHGENGFLAITDDEWEQALVQVLTDRTLSRAIGAAGRKTVEDDYSITANLPRLIQSLEVALRQHGAGCTRCGMDS